MKNYDTLIKGLQQDIEVPAEVKTKFRNTLNNLPDLPEKEPVKHRKHSWLKGTAAAAVILAAGIGFCYSNPVLASKIPIIGRIFAQIENDITFSGDYQDKKEVLTEAAGDTDSAAEETAVYRASGNGIEVTASEIYCDGYSVFLTAEIKSEDGAMSRIPEHSSGLEGEGLANMIYASGTWNIGSGVNAGEMFNEYVDGKVIGDDTFIGLIKIDLKQPVTGSGTLELNLAGIGYDDLEISYEDDITAAHKFEGSWDLSIPFHVDTESVREIDVNKRNEDGIGVKRVVLSPYQLIIFADVPNYSGIAVFNQDGQVLQDKPGYQNNHKPVYAVRGIDIRQLKIFIAEQGDDEIPMLKAKDVGTARSLAVMEVTVDLDE